jgi:hypothetical protein
MTNAGGKGRKKNQTSWVLYEKNINHAEFGNGNASLTAHWQNPDLTFNPV